MNQRKASKDAVLPLIALCFVCILSSSRYAYSQAIDCGSGAAAVQVSYGNSVSPNSTVNYPERAFDNDVNTYSILHVHNQQHSVEIVQIVSFSTTSSTSDIVKLYLSSLANLDTHYDVTAQAY
ncbi:MAG TPA: hypothetical protein VGB63_17995 [Pedobacter sp.]|jgi:hypothetical protein